MIHLVIMLLRARVGNNVVSTQQHRSAQETQPFMWNLSSRVKCLSMSGTFSYTITLPLCACFRGKHLEAERACVCDQLCSANKPGNTGSTTRLLQRWNFLSLRCVSLPFYCWSRGKSRKERFHSLFKTESRTKLSAVYIKQQSLIPLKDFLCLAQCQPTNQFHILSSYKGKGQFILWGFCVINQHKLVHNYKNVPHAQ